MAELKPCPFCESTNADTREHKPDCYLRKSFEGLPDKSYDFLAGYNTRPGEAVAEQRGYVKALEDVRRMYKPDEIIKGIELQVTITGMISAYEKEHDDGNQQ